MLPVVSTASKQPLTYLLPDCSEKFASIFIDGLTLDSRDVKAGDLFFALPGAHVSGRSFVDAAITQGAVAVLVEQQQDECVEIRHQVPIIPVTHLKEKMSDIAGRFYNHPSKQLSVLGVTGTNGKTTTSQFIAEALSLMGVTCGVIGTVGIGLVGSLTPSSHTTPHAIDVQRFLAQLLQQGAKAVVMEVSSHGLDQHRVESIQFHTALFTNLTRDHLDYHLTMDAYGQAKAKLFLRTELKRAVINFDDAFGKVLAEKTADHIPTYTYSLVSQKADITAKNIVFNEQGIRAIITTPWGEGELISSLLGRFNLSNLLGVLSVLCSYGYELNQSLSVLSRLHSVAGRMQRLGGDHQPLVVVDYAHSPDALQNVLITLREHCRGQLWCVFGCGGDRDAGKRSLMGEISALYADKVIITDDNPRFESSQKIIDAILSGIKNKKGIIVEANRSSAIEYAIAQASVNDVILIAGKGHEDYQESQGVKKPFNDITQAKIALHKRGLTQ